MSAQLLYFEGISMKKLLFFLLLLPCWGFSQNQELGMPFIKNYNPSAYAAHVQNFDLVQDFRGVMYFANFAGVLEFDGQSWRTIQTSDSIPARVTSLDIDLKGRIYVGARGELGFLAPDLSGILRFNSLLDSLDVDNKRFQTVVNIIATDDEVFFITNSSILLWDGSSFHVVKQDLSIQSAYYVHDKLYFFEPTKGLQYYYDEKFFSISLGDNISEAVEIRAMLPLNEGKVLICTGNNGLLFLQNSSVTTALSPAVDYIRNSIFSCAILLKDGTIALGTERSGLVLLNPDGSMKQQINQGMQSENVNSLYEDQIGNLWLALDYGITQVAVSSHISFYDERKGVEGNVNQILRNKGRLFFATNNGLYSYDDEADAFAYNPLIESSCWSILPDGDKILAATSRGVFLVDERRVSLIDDGFSLVLCLSQVDKSKVYVGQSEGIAKLEKHNNRWISVGKIPEIIDEIIEIEQDNKGVLWMVVSTRGIIKVNPNDNSKPVYYDDTKGLPSRFGNHINRVDHAIIVSTQEGLYQYNEADDLFAPMHFFFQDSILSKEWISILVEDTNDYVWYNNGEEKNIKWRRREGEDSLSQMILKPIKETIISTIYPEEDGKVWFGGPVGVIRYNPQIPYELYKEGNVLIRNVNVSGDSLIFGGTYYDQDFYPSLNQSIDLIPQLHYRNNTLNFNYSSPSFSINENIEFQFLLEGFDENWSVWDSKSLKEYTNLPAGKYRFNVRSKNVYDIVSESASFKFSIKKPWYQTIFAYVSYVIGLGIILVIVVRVRSQQLIREKQKLESLIDERTAEVVSQKEEIEIQSEKLSSKNDELEKINLIVKAINSEIHFASLLQSILDKIRIIGGVEKATMLVRDKGDGMFTFKAGFAWDVSSVSEVQLTLTQIDAYYLHDANEVHEHIFDVKNLNNKQGDSIFEKLEKPKSIMIMMVMIKEEVEGFLILENMYKKQVFSNNDFSLLYNLKEHVISAFIKTNILEDLQTTLTNLKEMQEQLIQQEKLASIGQLTKGIVDRILNPLNYINNFSLLSSDLSEESLEILEKIKELIDSDTFDDLVELQNMALANGHKINEHGTSASRIVKGMEKLLQERSTDFILTDINALVKSNVEIGVQGYKAESKSFKANVIEEFDAANERTRVLPSDLGIVIINTIENACYVLDEKEKKLNDYVPEIKVSTSYSDSAVEIRIKDNGPGIREAEKSKLFDPFFTTKPTSKGTGLGLYMSMDIVKAHKGNIEVESKEGEYTTFIIRLPREDSSKLSLN